VRVGNNVKIQYKQKQTIYSTVNGKSIDTGRKHLGAIIGDNVIIKPNTVINPGIKINPNQTISGEIKKDQ